MTREPDRYEAKARELIAGYGYCVNEPPCPHCIAVALRQAADEALERAAQRIAWIQPEYTAHEVQRQIRELKSPAAAHETEPSDPVAPADPCQRCGRLGGHGVEFRFNGISMSSWICPHCLDAQEKRIAALETALRELSRRASDPDLYRRVGASWLMLDGAVKEADALLTKEPRKP